MPLYSQKQLLKELSNQTECFLQKAIRDWQNIPAETFSATPAPDKWSARDCLSHLNSYGDYYLPLIEDALVSLPLSDKDTNAVFKSGWLGNYFIRLMQLNKEGGVSKKMKAAAKHQPEKNADSHAVIATFIDQQEKMLLLLDKAADLDLGSIRIPVSINKWIRLQLGDIFLFLVTHTERHVAQAEKALHREP
jgi:hypothetical protein